MVFSVDGADTNDEEAEDEDEVAKDEDDVGRLVEEDDEEEDEVSVVEGSGSYNNSICAYGVRSSLVLDDDKGICNSYFTSFTNGGNPKCLFCRF